MAANRPQCQCTLILWRCTHFKICHCLNHVMIIFLHEHNLLIICYYSLGTLMLAWHFISRGALPWYLSSAVTSRVDTSVRQERIQKCQSHCWLLVDKAPQYNNLSSSNGEATTYLMTNCYIWINVITNISGRFESMSHQHLSNNHSTDDVCTCL